MRDYTGHYITIGAQFACQSDRLAKVALQPLVRAIIECSGQSAPNTAIQVNVVFAFPGQFGDFGVKEMRAVRFSRKQGVLLKVPVPESLYDSAHQQREYMLLDRSFPHNGHQQETIDRLRKVYCD